MIGMCAYLKSKWKREQDTKTTTDSSPPCPFLGEPSTPLQKLGLLQKQTLGSRPNAAGKARRKNGKLGWGHADNGVQISALLKTRFHSKERNMSAGNNQELETERVCVDKSVTKQGNSRRIWTQFAYFFTNWEYTICLVVSTPLKNIYQLGWLLPIYYGKKCSKPPTSNLLQTTNTAMNLSPPGFVWKVFRNSIEPHLPHWIMAQNNGKCPMFYAHPFDIIVLALYIPLYSMNSRYATIVNYRPIYPHSIPMEHK